MAATDKARTGGGMTAAVTLVFCFLTAIIEGIDLQSMGIAAPSLKPEFGLSNEQLGWILAASPIGLFFGSFFGGRLADFFGRKAALVGSMLVFGVFQLTTVWAPNYEILGAIRLLCGLGLGGALPNLIALTSEAASGKSRIVSVVITAAGMPVGGGLASAIMFFEGAGADWRTVFYIGGIAPLLLAPVIALALPESRMFKAAKAAEAASGVAARKVGALMALFGENRAIATLLIWIAMLFTTIVTYLLLNWLPVLMVAKGFTKPEASFIQIWFNGGAAAGSIALGWLMERLMAAKPQTRDHQGRMVLFLCYGGLAVSLVGLTAITNNVMLASIAVAVTGAFLLGAQYIVYGLTPFYYRTTSRGTGTGAGVASGRLGSAVGPMLAGMLLSAGQSTTQVLQAMFPVVGVAAAAAILLMFRKQVDE
jgi:AAHS family 3-hydroxyphenylpropionic acid transporter